jgi:signal transduction histidine kinase
MLMLMHMFMMVVMHVFPVIRGTHSALAILIGGVLMAGGIAGVRRGLTPFRQLRERLLAVRAGEERRVAGEYPTEVQPLVDDLNALLEDREKAVRRAVATAGDLAHGLKTPLALLAQEADHAGAAGNPELADSISQQVERMSRQVNYHLARARAAASGAAGAPRCPLAACADALVRTVSKLYAGRGLHISSLIVPDLCARVQREDLEEILGNLLDNACKWAKSMIVLDAYRSGAMLVVTLDDDGPGLTADLRKVVLERGVRTDESSPGSGLGLAIVRDLVEVYGGSIALDESSLGGLRVQVSLPSS